MPERVVQMLVMLRDWRAPPLLGANMPIAIGSKED